MMLANAILGAALISDSKPTKANLARVIGVHRCQVVRWLQGTTKPSRHSRRMLKRLAWLARTRNTVREQVAHLRGQGEE